MRWLLAQDRSGAYGMIRRDASHGSVEAFFRCISDLRRVDLHPRLAEIRIPVLGVFGGRDDIVNPNQAVVMGRGVPHATICFLPDSRHFPILSNSALVRTGKNCQIDPSAVIQGPATIGHNSLVGAGTGLCRLRPESQAGADDACGDVAVSRLRVLGVCMRHNCRVDSDVTVFPGGTIESDTVLIRSARRGVVDGNVGYTNSDHHAPRRAAKHRHVRTGD